MTRVIRCGVATLLCLAALGAPRVFAQGALPTEDPCRAPNVRNDVRPGAGGPPTQVHVGVRLIDLLEVSDVDQTLTADLGVMLRWTDPRLAHLGPHPGRAAAIARPECSDSRRRTR